MAEKMRSTRDVVLGRIRAANRDAPASVFAPPPVEEWRKIPRSYQRTGSLSAPERETLFAERMLDYNAGVSYAEQGNLRAAIGSVLRGRGKNVLVVPEGFPAEWLPEDVHGIAERGLDTAALAAQENVITACTVAIAATGTVVLQHGAGEGARQLTLLPDYHLCIVQAAQIVETVPEAIAALAPTRPTTFISGPSATADIEMTRIKGVHGPRFLDVIIVR